MSQPVNGGRACPRCFQTGEDCHCGQRCLLCDDHVGPFRLAAHGTAVVCVEERACNKRALPTHQTEVAEVAAKARKYHEMYRAWSDLHEMYRTGKGWMGPKKMLGFEELLERIKESAISAQEEAAELYESILDYQR